MTEIPRRELFRQFKINKEQLPTSTPTPSASEHQSNIGETTIAVIAGMAIYNIVMGRIRALGEMRKSKKVPKYMKEANTIIMKEDLPEAPTYKEQIEKILKDTKF